MTPQSPRVAVRGVARAGRTTLGLALERPIMWALGQLFILGQYTRFVMA